MSWGSSVVNDLTRGHRRAQDAPDGSSPRGSARAPATVQAIPATLRNRTMIAKGARPSSTRIKRRVSDFLVEHLLLSTCHSIPESKAQPHKGQRSQRTAEAPKTSNTTFIYPWLLTSSLTPSPSQIQNEKSSFISHLFALGKRRVKSVVGKIPGEDVQFTRYYPPRIPKINFILWRKKGFKLFGKHYTLVGCRSSPIPQPRQSNPPQAQQRPSPARWSPQICGHHQCLVAITTLHPLQPGSGRHNPSDDFEAGARSKTPQPALQNLKPTDGRVR
ncbi:hypothetical protein LUU34_01322000 [Aix galericulata]|nr:hypothetical protein LUU34_01322000 [Aix galericulata]